MTDTLLALAPDVWLFPRDPDPARTQPNIGILTSGDQTLLIDAGNSPRHARRIMIALDEIKAPPVRYIVYTHSHWDHVFGGMIFGASVIAHESCRRLLAEMAIKPWSHAYIHEEAQRFPTREPALREMARAVEDWRSFRIVLPQVVFSNRLTLHLGDLTVELRHVGGGHAPESVTARVVERGILFAGDAFYPSPAAARSGEDGLNQPLMRSLLGDPFDLVVDGHGDPLPRGEFARLAGDSP